jgi:aspartate/tyrosine/aromatic aminotransferase
MVGSRFPDCFLHPAPLKILFINEVNAGFSADESPEKINHGLDMYLGKGGQLPTIQVVEKVVHLTRGMPK